MRFNNSDDLTSPSGNTQEISSNQAEGDFLTRLNLTIENIKELLKMAGKFKGDKEETENNPKPSGKLNPGAKALSVSDYIQLAIKAGYGEVPIGKIIEQVSPHSLNKIIEVLKDAGLKQ